MNLKMTAFFTLIFLTFLGGSSFSDTDACYSHYQIKLKLDPPSHYIKVKMNLKIISTEELPDTLVFSLHRQLSQVKVTGHGLASFIFDQNSPSPSIFMPYAKPLKIILDKNTRKDKPLTLSFEYEGNLTEWSEYSANVVTEDWVELGLYMPWIPLSPITGNFTFDIVAECDPAYQLRSYGDYTHDKNGIWYFKRLTPTFDIVLIASKNIKTIKKELGGKNIFLHYQALEDTTAEKLIDDLSGIFDMFDLWYGGNKKGEYFTLIISPREKGGGYSRMDLITMTGITDEKYAVNHVNLYRYLAHEIGHFWWNMAPTDSWEDWMNEGFAEYSAQLAVREIFGEETFNKMMENKKKNSMGTPPIWGFDRNGTTESGMQSPIIEINLYQKPPVLLHQLSERIGAGNFKELCKNMVKLNVSSTDDFLQLLEKNDGIDTKNWFENLLKTY
jgi:hypothetical protein